MKLAFLGDVYLSDEVFGSKGAEESLNIFQSVRNRLGQNGMLIANVEFSLSGKASPRPFKWATLCSNPKIVEHLKPLSVAVLANNHAGDVGLEGLEETNTNLQRAGIRTLGYGHNLEHALEPCFIDGPAGRVGIVALCCLTTNSQSIATHTEPGIPPISAQTLRLAINKAKREADVVIVFLHWGCEQSPYPVPDQVRLGRFAIDSGANAVVGCHAHVIQTYEEYKGCWIFHGVGNYYFSPVVAKQFQEGQFVRDVRIDHERQNRESLVPVFEVRDKKLELVDLFVSTWEGLQAPTIKEASSAFINLQAINKRLRRWIARNSRELRSSAEPIFHCKLHNGIIAYQYSKGPIHRDWSIKELIMRLSRRAQREISSLRRVGKSSSGLSS